MALRGCETFDKWHRADHSFCAHMVRPDCLSPGVWAVSITQPPGPALGLGPRSATVYRCLANPRGATVEVWSPAPPPSDWPESTSRAAITANGCADSSTVSGRQAGLATACTHNGSIVVSL